MSLRRSSRVAEVAAQYGRAAPEANLTVTVVDPGSTARRRVRELVLNLDGASMGDEQSVSATCFFKELVLGKLSEASRE